MVGRGPNLDDFWWVALIAVPVWLCVLSALLRTSVWAANKCRGQPTPAFIEDESEEEEAPRRGRRGQYQHIIPAPGFGGGVVIALIALVVHFVFGCVTGLIMNVAIKGAALGPGDGVILWVSRGFALAVGFLVWWGVLVVALPTSLGRAGIVTLFFYLQVVLLGVMIAVPVFVLALVLGA